MKVGTSNITKTIYGTVLALFASQVPMHEGIPTTKNGMHNVYYDSAGVKTACYGETKNLTKQYYTTEECKSMLGTSAKQYATVLDDLPSLPTVTYAGVLDFTYNAGKSAFLNSSVRKCLLNSDTTCASKAVLQYRFISKSTLPKGMSHQYQWKYNTSKHKYYYDCSNLVNGKPNSVCYGLWKRRQFESLLIKGDISPEQATELLQKWY